MFARTTQGVALLSMIVGCGASAPPPEPPPSVLDARIRFLIYRWQSGSRAQLESVVRQKRAVIVHYDPNSNKMDVLPDCASKLQEYYRYTPTPAGGGRYSDNQEKGAGGALEFLSLAKVGASGDEKRNFEVAFKTVGMYEPAVGTPRDVFRDELQGNCDRATHIIVDMEVGALEYFTGSHSRSGAELKGRGQYVTVEGSGSVEGHSSMVVDMGKIDACAKADLGDSAPPKDCNHVVSVNMEEIRPGNRPSADSKECPASMRPVLGGRLPLDLKDASRMLDVAPFCMDEYEVTVRQYGEACPSGQEGCLVRAKQRTGSDAIVKHWSKYCTANDPEKYADHPIVCVTWMEADAYCRGMGKRLPTEFEWELAARGPSATLYPWGNARPTAEDLNACGEECRHLHVGHILPDGEISKSLNCKADKGRDGFQATAPVESFKDKDKSAFEIHGLAGNVAEWTSSLTTEKSRAVYVAKGGSWAYCASDVAHATYRNPAEATTRAPTVGFRCVKDVAR